MLCRSVLSRTLHGAPLLRRRMHHSRVRVELKWEGSFAERRGVPGEAQAAFAVELLHDDGAEFTCPWRMVASKLFCFS